MPGPTDDPGNDVSLSCRAPTVPVPSRTWRMHFSYNIGRIQYANYLVQESPCIRTRRVYKFHKNRFTITTTTQLNVTEVGPGVNVGVEMNTERGRNTVVNPYPVGFKELHDQVVDSLGRTWMDSITHSIVHNGRTEWRWGFSNRILGIRRTLTVEYDSRVQPANLVLGIFSRANSDPKEQVAVINDHEALSRAVTCHLPPSGPERNFPVSETCQGLQIIHSTIPDCYDIYCF